jgi:hypothetical protein
MEPPWEFASLKPTGVPTGLTQPQNESANSGELISETVSLVGKMGSVWNRPGGEIGNKHSWGGINAIAGVKGCQLALGSYGSDFAPVAPLISQPW